MHGLAGNPQRPDGPPSCKRKRWGPGGGVGRALAAGMRAGGRAGRWGWGLHLPRLARREESGGASTLWLPSRRLREGRVGWDSTAARAGAEGSAAQHARKRWPCGASEGRLRSGGQAAQLCYGQHTGAAAASGVGRPLHRGWRCRRAAAGRAALLGRAHPGAPGHCTVGAGGLQTRVLRWRRQRGRFEQALPEAHKTLPPTHKHPHARQAAHYPHTKARRRCPPPAPRR